MPSAPSRRTWSLVIAVTLTVAACSKDDNRGGSSTSELRRSTTSTSSVSSSSTSVASPTTTQIDVDKQAVLAAYEGYFKAILAANDPPNQFHPDLRRYATGAAFESVFRAAQANRLAGHALRLPAGSKTAHRGVVESIDRGAATVRDCAVDDVTVVDLASGKVLNSTVATQLRLVHLLREGTTWRVDFTRLEQRWEGVSGCALER